MKLDPNERVAVLQRVLGEHLTSRSRLDLLVFWGRYPGGWFGRRAVRPFTRSSRKDIERALDELVVEGVIQCRRDGGVSLYALTPDAGIRQAVQELPRLTRHERRSLLQEAMRQHGGSVVQHDAKPSPEILRRIIRGAEA